MIVFAVVLVAWVVLTLPVAVLMGKCISLGLARPPAPEPVPTHVPAQRSAVEDAVAPVPVAGNQV